MSTGKVNIAKALDKYPPQDIISALVEAESVKSNDAFKSNEKKLGAYFSKRVALLESLRLAFEELWGVGGLTRESRPVRTTLSGIDGSEDSLALMEESYYKTAAEHANPDVAWLWAAYAGMVAIAGERLEKVV